MTASDRERPGTLLRGVLDRQRMHLARKKLKKPLTLKQINAEIAVVRAAHRRG